MSAVNYVSSQKDSKKTSKYFTHFECNASLKVTNNHPADTFIILLYINTDQIA